MALVIARENIIAEYNPYLCLLKAWISATRSLLDEATSWLNIGAFLLFAPVAPVFFFVYLSIPDTSGYEQVWKPIRALARLTYGEARGEPYLGEKAVVATVFNRVDSPHHFFPDTIVEVVYQPRPKGKGCMYNAICDDIDEDLTNWVGIKIVAHTAFWYLQYRYRIFEDPTMGAHSYCVPKVCKHNIYFQRKLWKRILIGNHAFYKSPPMPRRKPRFF